jgi:phosphonate transport system substrate-binding protein
VTYTSGHDATMRLIAEGKVAAGAVNASLAYAALASGDTAGRRLRVLWRSPPFTDYVWAGRKELSASLRQRLTDAFLDLDRAVPAQRIALDHEGAGGYVPAYVEEFEKIATILRERREL